MDSITSVQDLCRTTSELSQKVKSKTITYSVIKSSKNVYTSHMPAQIYITICTDLVRTIEYRVNGLNAVNTGDPDESLKLTTILDNVSRRKKPHVICVEIRAHTTDTNHKLKTNTFEQHYPDVFSLSDVNFKGSVMFDGSDQQTDWLIAYSSMRPTQYIHYKHFYLLHQRVITALNHASLSELMISWANKTKPRYGDVVTCRTVPPIIPFQIINKDSGRFFPFGRSRARAMVRKVQELWAQSPDTQILDWTEIFRKVKPGLHNNGLQNGMDIAFLLFIQATYLSHQEPCYIHPSYMTIYVHGSYSTKSLVRRERSLMDLNTSLLQDVSNFTGQYMLFLTDFKFEELDEKLNSVKFGHGTLLVVNRQTGQYVHLDPNGSQALTDLVYEFVMDLLADLWPKSNRSAQRMDIPTNLIYRDLQAEQGRERFHSFVGSCASWSTYIAALLMLNSHRSMEDILTHLTHVMSAKDPVTNKHRHMSTYIRRFNQFVYETVGHHRTVSNYTLTKLSCMLKTMPNGDATSDERLRTKAQATLEKNQDYSMHRSLRKHGKVLDKQWMNMLKANPAMRHPTRHDKSD